jgi:aspartyl-tRNA(Asn)/glutamyl-tRNA(Gln) amidotransferase subunit B
LPGALPYVNQDAVDRTIRFGLSMGSTIATFSKFDRKHYFYPDLPKSFQTSQYDLPFCEGGSYSTGDKTFRIRRIHLEEDTAKLQHQVLDGKSVSLIDFNRGGVPLVELVTEPDFHDPEDVLTFLKYIQLVVRTLGISSADMEKGSMRLEANVSLSPDGSLPSYKVELKNINSFRFLKKAIEAELTRQEALLHNNESIPQETRGFDERTGKTVLQRTKEDAHDYRYFPEPDIAPIVLSEAHIAGLRDLLPELPAARLNRYVSEYNIPEQIAQVIVYDLEKTQLFEDALLLGKTHGIGAQTLATFIVNKLSSTEALTPQTIIDKLYALTTQSFSSDEETRAAVLDVIASSSAEVASYKAGKVALLGFFIGQTQKILKGKGNPKMIQEILLKHLQTE